MMYKIAKEQRPARMGRSDRVQFHANACITAVYAGLGLKLASKRRGLLDALLESYGCTSTQDQRRRETDVSTYGIANTPDGNRNTLGYLQACLRNRGVGVRTLWQIINASPLIPRGNTYSVDDVELFRR